MRTMLIAALAASTLVSTPAPASTPTAEVATPSPAIVVHTGRPRCTQEKFRSLARKVYAKRKIPSSDHEMLYRARRCLKHASQALTYQRELGERRKERLDPWQYAWDHQISSAMKSRLNVLGMCESTNNYRATNGTHWGRFQYDYATWAEAGGSGRPDLAPPREQDVRTARFYPGHEGRWECKA